MTNILNTEDKLVVSKAEDTIYLSEKRFSPVFYGFLNEHESSLIKENIHLNDECIFWGGYPCAKRLFFGSGVTDTDLFPIDALCFTYKDNYKLSHRDFLGSLMALGIERSTIGDIIVSDGCSIAFVKSDISQYIKQEVRKIGRIGVKVTDYDFSNFDFEEKYDEVVLSVSSLRLDVFVSALCNLSRDKSSKLITSELVTINHQVVTNISKLLDVNDVVTVRKFGKFVFAEVYGHSKKGKIRISVKHFR